MTNDVVQWLLESDEPWTCYRTLLDLLDRSDADAEVEAARAEMLAHPQVLGLIAEVAEWPGPAPLRRHNNAGHPMHKLSVLAEFGVRADDPGVDKAIDAVLARQSPEGAFQIVANVPKAFGGTGEDMWTWMLCDAPVLLYSLLAMGLGENPRVKRAVEHLLGLVDDNGWRCVADSELAKFRGPGRKADPCPIVNVYALKALSQVPGLGDHPAIHKGAEMLLWHWEHQTERKIYMFGIGTTFRRLKCPFVWYDVLHVVDVLSRFPFVHGDPRFREMLRTITAQADEEGRYTAGSMYKAWKGWSFADKKHPSPWLTLVVKRVERRAA